MNHQRVGPKEKIKRGQIKLTEAKDLFIIDNYLDTQLFDVYVENINSAVNIRVLTSQVSDPLRVVAEKFALRGNFELRSSKRRSR